MISCDCCGTPVNERTLQTVGIHFVCLNCFHGYSDEELKDKLDAKSSDGLIQIIGSIKNLQENYLQPITPLRARFKEETHKEAILYGIINPEYMRWLEAIINQKG